MSIMMAQFFFLKFNHLSEIYIEVGFKVGPGYIIGKSGVTGNASSAGVTPHVHIQIPMLIIF